MRVEKYLKLIINKIIIPNMVETSFFADLINVYCKKNKTCIVFDGYPIEDGKYIDKDASIEMICKTYNFKIIYRSSKFLVLEKMYIDPQDLPDVSYLESVYSSNQIKEIEKVIAPSSLSFSAMAGGLKALRNYAGAINTDQLVKMKHGIPVSEFASELKRELKQKAYSIHLRYSAYRISSAMVYQASDSKVSEYRTKFSP